MRRGCGRSSRDRSITVRWPSRRVSSPIALSLQLFRWFILIRALDLPFSLRNTFRLGMVGVFYNTFLPGSVGGDLLKAYFIAKEHPERKARAIATVIADRALGLFGLILFVAALGSLAWAGGDARIIATPGLQWLIKLMAAHRGRIDPRVPGSGVSAGAARRALRPPAEVVPEGRQVAGRVLVHAGDVPAADARGGAVRGPVGAVALRARLRVPLGVAGLPAGQSRPSRRRSPSTW